MNKLISKLIPFNKEQRMNWYMGLLRDPKITQAQRSEWLDKLPLTEKERFAFMAEASEKLVDHLLPKI